jgi:hypothetical protein
VNRDIYLFHLYDPFPPGEHGKLCLKDKSHIRARIFSQEGRKLTLKFEGEIDYSDIPQQGSLVRAQNEEAFKAQHRAVGKLDKCQAKNEHLLHVLVDRLYQSYTTDTTQPVEKLNIEQTKAFQKALTVPDMLGFSQGTAILDLWMQQLNKLIEALVEKERLNEQAVNQNQEREQQAGTTYC